MWEQQHFPDGVLVGQQHHQTVDAHADAAGRRQAIFQRLDIVDIHLIGFVISQITQLQLIFEAFALIDRIIQLREGIGIFLSVDEQLIAVCEARVIGVLLGQRRDRYRMAIQIRRLDQGLFHIFLKEQVDDVADAVVLLFHFDAVFLRDCACLFVAHLFPEINSAGFLDGVYHMQTAVRRLQ